MKIGKSRKDTTMYFPCTIFTFLGFSLCLLACLVSGLLAYRRESEPELNCECFDSETCCLFATDDLLSAYGNGSPWQGVAPFCLNESGQWTCDALGAIQILADDWAEVLQRDEILQQDGPPPPHQPPTSNGWWDRPPLPPPPPPSNDWEQQDGPRPPPRPPTNNGRGDPPPQPSVNN